MYFSVMFENVPVQIVNILQELCQKNLQLGLFLKSFSPNYWHVWLKIWPKMINCLNKKALNKTVLVTRWRSSPQVLSGVSKWQKPPLSVHRYHDLFSQAHIHHPLRTAPLSTLGPDQLRTTDLNQTCLRCLTCSRYRPLKHDTLTVSPAHPTTFHRVKDADTDAGVFSGSRPAGW